MVVYKSDKSYEEYDANKVRNGICEAYVSANEPCDDNLINSIVSNLFVYEKISSNEIRRQVEEALMGLNKKVAKAYIERFEDDRGLKKRNDFIKNYIQASNASTGSKYDSNANVSNKNIATLNAEIPKQSNIKFNRYNTCNKISNLFSKKLAKQYLEDLNNHIIYKNDESSFGINSPYTYSSKEVIEVKYNDRHLLLPFDMLWNILEEDEVLVNKTDCAYQKYPQNLYVKDLDNKFTHVSVMTKKLRKRDLVRVKTAFGEDVIVTDNHPMIIDKDNVENTIQAIDSLDNQQYKIGTKLEFGNINEIENEKHFNKGFKIDEELGYFIGFFVANGKCDNDEIIFSHFNKGKLSKLNEISFNKFGFYGYIDNNNLTILNESVIWLIKDFFKIQKKFEDRTLPYNLLDFSESFSKGLISGLIESNGSSCGYGANVEVLSRSLSLQLISLLRHFKYDFISSMIDSCGVENIWKVDCIINEESVPFEHCNELRKENIWFGDYKNIIKLMYEVDGKVKIIGGEKYFNKEGYAIVTDVSKVNDNFLKQNEFIYDITTDTHTFECNNLLVHNCVAIQSYPFLTDGLKGIGGLSAAPKNLDSFCGMFVNLIFAVSSQFAGACAVAGTFNMFDYYARKEWGDDYYLHDDRTAKVKYENGKEISISIDKQIEQYFQQIVYSINQPAAARGFQSA